MLLLPPFNKNLKQKTKQLADNDLNVELSCKDIKKWIYRITLEFVKIENNALIVIELLFFNFVEIEENVEEF